MCITIPYLWWPKSQIFECVDNNNNSNDNNFDDNNYINDNINININYDNNHKHIPQT